MAIRNEYEETLAEDVSDAEMFYGEDEDDDDQDFEVALAEYDDDDDDDEGETDDYDDDDESYAEYDDDDDDDESEFLHMVLPQAFRAAKRLFRGRSIPVRRHGGRRFNRYRMNIPRGSVRGGWVNTPRGRVRLRLPRSVVSSTAFKAATARTSKQINGLNSRINRTQKDLKSVDKKASRAVAGSYRNRRAITRLSNSSQKQMRRYQKRNKTAMEKIKKSASSQATTNMLMNMMQNNQIQSQLRSHTHPDHDEVSDTIAGTNNSMMTFLPMLMNDDDGDSDNSMMMMMMMMSMQSANQNQSN